MKLGHSAAVIAQRAKDHGFSQVETAGGWISLDEWTPYGHRDDHDVITFSLVPRNRRINEVVSPDTPCPPGLVTGVWTIR